MMRLLAIARNAFIETIRQPIYGVLILVTFAVLVLDVPLSSWTMGSGNADYEVTDQQLLVSLGLSTLLVSGLLISAFSAAGVLSREIEERTILTVVSKPVSRPVIVAGKFAGVCGALSVAYYLCAIVLTLTVRHKVMSNANDPYDMPVIVLGCAALGASILVALFCNYFFGWHFASAAVGLGVVFLTAALAVVCFVGKEWTIVPFGEDIPPAMLVAMLLMFFGVLVFSAVAVAASTRLGQVMTLLVCIGFFFLGSMSEYVVSHLPAQSVVTKMLYVVFPNLTFFYAIDAFTSNRIISGTYVALNAAYMVCYVVAILAIGMALFHRRELEASSGAASAPPFVNLIAWLGRGAAVACGLYAIMISMALQIVGSHSLPAAAVLAVLAIGGWIYWGLFGRGVSWTYYTTLGAGILALAIEVTDWILPQDLLRLPDWALVLGVAVAAIGVVILFLPKTRDHFGLVGKSRRKSGLLPTTQG